MNISITKADNGWMVRYWSTEYKLNCTRLYMDTDSMMKEMREYIDKYGA